MLIVRGKRVNINNTRKWYIVLGGCVVGMTSADVVAAAAAAVDDDDDDDDAPTQ